MKTLVPTLVATFALATQSLSLAADPVPVGPTPSKTDVIVVTHIKADADGDIKATISSKSSTVLSATYKISRLIGGNWSQIKTGTISIPAKKTSDFGLGRVQRTKEEQKIRLDVTVANPKLSSARELSMHPKKLFILKYKTRGWVQIAYQFQKTTSELTGQAVKAPAAEARKLGFQTKIKTDTTTVLFGTDSYRTYAYARMDNYTVKTFETTDERDRFKRMIYKVVPSYTNDGPGLISQEEEK